MPDPAGSSDFYSCFSFVYVGLRYRLPVGCIASNENNEKCHIRFEKLDTKKLDGLKIFHKVYIQSVPLQIIVAFNQENVSPAHRQFFHNLFGECPLVLRTGGEVPKFYRP